MWACMYVHTNIFIYNYVCMYVCMYCWFSAMLFFSSKGLNVMHWRLSPIFCEKNAFFLKTTVNFPYVQWRDSMSRLIAPRWWAKTIPLEHATRAI
jgi:hypothetical protein